MAETSETTVADEKNKNKIPLDTDKEPIISQHTIGDLKYSAQVGMLPIKSDTGEVRAGIFYTAYKKDGVDDVSQRPIMFTFNGGPGSASVWLHLGAVGPKRIELLPDGQMPAPPYKLIDNPDTWLQHADLVFIDPVGTGYSRAAEKEWSKEFWGLEGDLESVAEFIRLYLTREGRWSSPVYIAGESYGTTRAAGLSGKLVDRGVALNGVILVSSILNFQTARFTKGNDLPYILFLPTYTAAAWYHGKLKGFEKLSDALSASQQFASLEYTTALGMGDRIDADTRAKIVTRLSELTGLSEDYIDGTDLRINIHRFCKELLRSEKRTVGRMDVRFKGIDELSINEHPQHDPSTSALLPPYTAMINDYLSRTLGYKTDVPYHVFAPGELWANWTYGDAGKGYPDTSESLRNALSKNPYMKVFVASGFYDLATPYFATQYTLSHLGLDPSLKENFSAGYYEAGHMMYIDEKCLAQLAADIGKFMKISS